MNCDNCYSTASFLVQVKRQLLLISEEPDLQWWCLMCVRGESDDE